MQTHPVYAVDTAVSFEEYRQLLLDSGLSKYRPVDDVARLEAMLRNANLTVTARLEGMLVGIARSVTDRVFCCYLSDLAVSKHAQGHGIGARLIDETRTQGGPQVSMILSSVPESVSFYERIGMPALPNGFWHRRKK